MTELLAVLAEGDGLLSGFSLLIIIAVVALVVWLVIRSRG